MELILSIGWAFLLSENIQLRIEKLLQFPLYFML